MAPTSASLNSGSNFAVTKSKIIAVLSLILTWAFAHVLPTLKPMIKAQLTNTANIALQKLPSVKIDWFPEDFDPRTQFNVSKVALLIEGRTVPHLVPQLLHMISVVPPDWRFVFIGSKESVVQMDRSFATQYHQANGKLDLIVIGEPWSIQDKEHVYRMLTDIRFYDVVLPEVEWLLKFESDSIMCGNSKESLNDWLDYDWAGAPRNPNDKFAGNGGLSFRRISAVRRILSFQQRYDNTDPEDEWFGRRLTSLQGAKVASAEMEKHFAVEDVWHDNPMGYHVREGGNNLADDVWKSREKRKKIFDYCPELTMIMPMKLERERCEADDGEGHLDEQKQKEIEEAMKAESQ
ncbi:hypothetical protein F5884DRAFT_768528 [Xylogone sp. PMI_703]|nr:hypothetical protein F5884DRAFT_768528 [Xylogone sp. PMI_703]